MMKDEIPPRRIVLRGALAVGWSLLVPAALFGCDSKKDATSTGAAPDSSPPPASTDSATPPASADAAAPGASADSSTPAAAKVSQASVQYQTQPKGDQKCSLCQHFIAESNTCKLVEGQISPEGWCTLWAKKA